MRKVAAILGVVAVAVAGCTQSHQEENMAAAVSVHDQWASAATTGMTSVFGIFENTGHHDAHIVSALSPVAGTVEIHEVVETASGKNMRAKDDGFTIPAGGTHDLAPGGDHLMLMDLNAPLHPGADIEVTVVFEDGSTLPVTAQVRDFAGGNEDYQPATPHDHG